MSVFHASIIGSNTQLQHEAKVMSTPITLVMTLAFRYLAIILLNLNRDTTILNPG
jgi:hypothetical protein